MSWAEGVRTDRRESRAAERIGDEAVNEETSQAPGETVTYYGLLGGDRTADNPSGVLRRRAVEGGEPVDEIFTRNLVWEPSDFLFRYHMLGHNDVDYVEISAAQAAAFVDRVTRKLGG